MRDNTEWGHQTALAIECSSEPCSLAWTCDGGVNIAFQEFEGGRRASVQLIAELERAISGGVRPGATVVGRGPGSYSGLRSAFCAAMGLSAARGGRVWAINSLLAMPVDAQRYKAAGDAGRRKIFVAEVDRGRCEVTVRLMNTEEAKQELGAGGVMLALPSLPAELRTGLQIVAPDARRLLRLWVEQGNRLPCEPLEPVYLQSAVAEVPPAA